MTAAPSSRDIGWSRSTSIYRVINRWELERREGTWLIARRTTRLLGHEEAAALFAVALARPA